MKITYVWATLICILFFSCSSNQMVKKDSLTKLDSPIRSIFILDPFEFIFEAPLATVENILDTGEYIPIGKDVNGVYFIGPPACLTQRKKFKLNCGIYVNSSNSQIWNVFVFTGENTEYTKHSALKPAMGDGALPIIVDSLFKSYVDKRYEFIDVELQSDKIKYTMDRP